MANIDKLAKSLAPPNVSIPKLSPIATPKVPAFDFKNPLVESVKENSASAFHSRLVKMVNDFDAELDDSCEVGVRLVNFGQTVVFHLKALGYWNPSLIVFHGTNDHDDPVQLIQHISQISV